MKWRTRIAVLAALVVETVNFFVLTPPIDVGYPTGTPWYIETMGLEWVVLHLPALFTLDVLERISGCHRSDMPGGCRQVDISVLFAGGFLDTAVLFVCLTFAYRWFARRRANKSST